MKLAVVIGATCAATRDQRPEVYAELLANRAVISGRRTYERARR